MELAEALVLVGFDSGFELAGAEVAAIFGGVCICSSGRAGVQIRGSIIVRSMLGSIRLLGRVARLDSVELGVAIAPELQMCWHGLMLFSTIEISASKDG